ncbi:hypothetical protein DEJ48_38345 [Streptomyces venezuelae]|uniref:Integral membrane protein n=1 Tax=Streptomyces venezuelae TaxID=54571 RepID=A0A5P2C7F0_STRVZ|nr:hypothetical protein [Streptomyces venezuelae]QES38503.1 hypothetical protein DEJ48_38345 [Streptomyces venezuelae]
MRAISAVATAALTTATAFTIAVPSATAGDQPSFSATPDPAKPGDDVVLSVSGGCEAESATARSDAFESQVTLSTGSAGIYTGTAKIRPSTQAGSYDVDVDCEGGVSSYSLDVAGSVMPSPPHPMPTRGSHAGIGGSGGGGSDWATIGLGAGLVGAVWGAVWFRVRRPEDGQGH